MRTLLYSCCANMKQKDIPVRCQIHKGFEREGFSLTLWAEGRDLWSEMCDLTGVGVRLTTRIKVKTALL